jgi:asparagine synthase (glutamine-hydrolysing)
VCGIAGIVDLQGQRRVAPRMLQRMALAIKHRGPDEDGFIFPPGLGLASRRLSIVGIKDGRQPIFNEDRTVAVVFNGELFDYVEKRNMLRHRGHQFRTSSDTEVLVHLWEEHGEAIFDHLRGQYSFALYDSARRVLILARDRLGICPLFWARRASWLYFGSEIKAILSSGALQPEADPLGIDHVFTFFAMGTRRTAFKDIWAINPGSYLKIQFRDAGQPAEVSEHRYWDLEFPDTGEEYDPSDTRKLIGEFRDIFFRAVRLRLRADVPVVGYLSGGIDSTSVVSAATKILGKPVPTFTIKIDAPHLDETERARIAARHIGTEPSIVRCDQSLIARTYPKLVMAAEAPVVDTSCATLYCLAQEVHRQGYKVALTGEGADEALAGYPWFKVNKLLGLFDTARLCPGNLLRRACLKIVAPQMQWSTVKEFHRMVGGPHASADFYGLISLSRNWFYSLGMWARLGNRVAWEDLQLNLDGMKRWHPLNRSLYMGYKIILPGLLMNHKGDRPAMANSVENRYPFLDEEVVAFCAGIHPRWKLRGIMRDKHLLRTMGVELLPRSIASRPKQLFRAPFADSFLTNTPKFVEQLLSDGSLRKTGYFNHEQVRHIRARYRNYPWALGARLILEMGLTAVIATQLWHHLYIGGGLCDLPTWSPPEVTAL